MPKKSKTKSNTKNTSRNTKYTKYNKTMSENPLIEAFDNKKMMTNAADNTTIRNILILSVIIGLVILTINVYAILWINKLDTINCACSESYMRTYIKYYLYVFIPMICIDILINVYLLAFNVSILDMVNNTLYNIYKNIRTVFTIFSIINIVIVIIFINKLKEINCECSEDIVREVYWIYNIVLASYIGIVVLLAFMAIMMLMFSKMKN
jgi:hypothetical protein